MRIKLHKYPAHNIPNYKRIAVHAGNTNIRIRYTGIFHVQSKGMRMTNEYWILREQQHKILSHSVVDAPN